MDRKLKRFIQAFMSDQQGSVLILMAVGLVVCFGFASLAVDASYFYLLKNKLQTTADVAVLAASRQLPDEDATRATALEYVEKNMPANNHGNVLAAVDVVVGNWDSDTRTFTPGSSPINAVRVVTRRSQANGNEARTFFANVLGFSSVDIGTSAIAVSVADGEACVLALSGSASGAISTSGGAIVSMDSCSVMANSTAPDAVSISGSSSLEVDCVSAVGGVSGSPTLNFCSSVNEGATAILDPYAGINIPSVSYCDVSGNYNTQDGSLTDINGDGFIKICGNLTIKGNFTLQNDVTYIIEGAFVVNSGAVANATSVTFIVQDKVTINGGASFNISAPTWDQQFVDQTGMVFIQDPNTPYSSNNEVKLNGGSTTEFTGVIYVPNNDITFTGGNTVNSDGCTQIVALTVSFGGNADIDNNCDILGVNAIVVAGSSSLVR